MENPVEREAVLEWLESRTGETVPSLNGKALQSVYDPGKEAVRQIEALHRRLEAMESVQRVLIVGSGGPCFYNALAVSRLPGLYRLAIYEPHSSIFDSIVRAKNTTPAGMSGKDDSRARGDGNQDIEILLLANRREAQAYAESPGIFLYGHPGSLRAHSLYGQELSFLESLIQKRQINSNTLSRFGSQWVRNLYANVTRAIGSASINELRNAYRGQAAVVLGAGPSLADHIGAVASFQKSGEPTLIIAVDTALSTCRLHGVEPDFVVTVDAQPINYYHLADSAPTGAGRGIPRTHTRTDPHGARNPVLILDPAASPLAARRWVGPVIITGNPLPLSTGLNEIGGKSEPDQLSYGGSVSTNAYDLALYLGCTAILLVGQDLSFTETRVHAKGSALEELWSYKEWRLQSRETGNYRQRFAIPVVPLPGENQNRVHSNAKLEVFYQWFRSRLKKDSETLNVGLLRSQGALFVDIPLFDSMQAWYEQLRPGEKLPGIEEPDVATPAPESGFPDVGPVRTRIEAKEWPREKDLIIQRITELQREFRGLDDLLQGPNFQSHWTQYARAIRLAGTGMQSAVKELETSGEVSAAFKEQLAHQTRLHLTQLMKLQVRLSRVHSP